MDGEGLMVMGVVVERGVDLTLSSRTSKTPRCAWGGGGGSGFQTIFR